MKYLIVLCLSVFLFSWCTSEKSIAPTTQNISFLTYSMDVPMDFVAKPKEDVVDPRVMKKIVSVYQNSNSSLVFADNVIISQDTLTPRISLEDYVQAAIGGIAYTRWQYKSISFSKSTRICHKKEIPTIKNIFSIYRTASLTNEAETLYFVQYFVHNNEEVVAVSFSTNDETKIDTFSPLLDTMSCV